MLFSEYSEVQMQERRMELDAAINEITGGSGRVVNGGLRCARIGKGGRGGMDSGNGGRGGRGSPGGDCGYPRAPAPALDISVGGTAATTSMWAWGIS